MAKMSPKTLALVVSAIKNLRELQGSTSREILHYITSEYDVTEGTVKRQMQAALKRGLAYGILKRAYGHYSLPADTDDASQEIAAQEIGLIERCGKRRRRRRRSGCKKKRRRCKRRKRKRKCGKKRRRRRKKCGRRRNTDRDMDFHIMASDAFDRHRTDYAREAVAADRDQSRGRSRGKLSSRPNFKENLPEVIP